MIGDSRVTTKDHHTTENPTDFARVLGDLVSLLGTTTSSASTSSSTTTNTKSKWDGISWEVGGGEESNEEDFDFSSFPSLSLEHPPHDGAARSSRAEHSRNAVESRVASFLAKPILACPCYDMVEESSSDDDSWIARSLQDVPSLMLENLSASFATLMDSRLRTYYKFLFRHWQSLTVAENSSSCLDNNNNDPAVKNNNLDGILQKLDKMQRIATSVVVDEISTDFSCYHHHHEDFDATSKVDGDDDDCRNITLPLSMTVRLNVEVNHHNENDNKSNNKTVLPLTFSVRGSIDGLFGDNTAALRAVEVHLDTQELLACMIKKTSQVISLIVDMTNQAYAHEHSSSSESSAARTTSTTTKEVPMVVRHATTNRRAAILSKGGLKSIIRKRSIWIEQSPTTTTTQKSVVPRKVSFFRLNPQEEEEDSASVLSSCEYLVDSVIGEVHTAVLTAPGTSRKRPRLE